MNLCRNLPNFCRGKFYENIRRTNILFMNECYKFIFLLSLSRTSFFLVMKIFARIFRRKPIKSYLKSNLSTDVLQCCAVPLSGHLYGMLLFVGSKSTSWKKKQSHSSIVLATSKPALKSLPRLKICKSMSSKSINQEYSQFTKWLNWNMRRNQRHILWISRKPWKCIRFGEKNLILNKKVRNFYNNPYKIEW